MLSSLPKLADRNFVLGFLVPTLIFTMVGLWMYRDVEPVTSIWAATLQEKSLTGITLLGIGIWAAAIVLLVCNHSIYQLLEGYWGPFRRVKWRAAMQQRFATEQECLRVRYRELKAIGGGGAPEAESEYSAKVWDFYTRFPYRKDLVLPTRFGNVIRAFETYTLKVYGVDSIPGWVRLAGVVPKGMQSLVDNARAEVDFFVNLWTLAILLGAAAMGRWVLWLVSVWPIGGIADVSWLFPGCVAAAIAVAWGSYEGAVARARPWGELVKSAFDLYLPVLAKQLGYALPEKRVDRERFWGAVTGMFLQFAPLEPEVWPKAAPTGNDRAGRKGEPSNGAPPDDPKEDDEEE
jgi:hypothetical protein